MPVTDSAEKLTRLSVPLDEPLSAAQRASGFAIPGCSGPEGCFNVAAPAAMTLGSTGACPDVAFGSTSVMAVALTPGGVQAATILTYSEAAIAADPGLRVRRLVG